MNNIVGQSDTAMFQNTWQTWLILRHFLPARLQRQLVHDIVRIASAGTIQFEDLFEEVVIQGPIWNESWMIRPRARVKEYSRQKEYAAALQLWAQSVVWQNDEDTLGSRDDEEDSSRISLVFLHIVTMHATVDFGWPEAYFDAHLDRYSALIHPSLRCFLDTFKVAQAGHHTKEPRGYWDELEAMVGAVEMPLRAIMLKHFADLCADIDGWKHALEGYQRAGSILATWDSPAEWSTVASCWKNIVLQSRAAALRNLHGITLEPSILETAIHSAKLEEDPMLGANAGLDMIASRSDERSYEDPRVAWQRAPLMHASHHAHHALSHWMVAKHRDANRWFWSLLRRQIALGAATTTRETKGLYARCMVDEIAANFGSQDHAKSFVSAMRLLLESENEKHIAQMNWTSAVIDEYVTNEAIIKALLEHAHAHEGTKLRRTLVLIELFKVWALKITPSRKTIVEAIWKHLAYIARDFKADFYHQKDIGRPALKALRELGKSRPEFIQNVGADVAEAICKKLREEFEWGRVEASKAALPYAEAWDDVSFVRVTQAILESLEEVDAVQDSGHYTNEAFLFLVNPDIRKRLQANDELRQRALKQIFRYGLANEVQPMMIFFHLADFEDKLLEEEEVREQLADQLQRVRIRALQGNSSDVDDNIRALLVAPRIAGFEGIRDALDGLEKVIDSAKSGTRVSVGFPFIDSVLLLLVEYKARIRAALPGHQTWFDEKLVELAEHLAEMWEFARTNPMVFAPFAIPAPTKPNLVAIHNCAFASMRFAHAVGREERIDRALDKACESDVLRPQSVLARATHASGAKYTGNGQQVIGEFEDRNTFYESIGRRLTYLQRLAPEEAKPFATKLIEKCMQLGPHPADAGVFLVAANLGLHEQVRANGLRVYEKRVRNDSETRFLLLPLMDLFWPAQPSEGD